MLDFTFLSQKQVVGSEQLDILKKYGNSCAITDFSILLGGCVCSDVYTSEGETKKDRVGFWWTKTPYYDDVIVVNEKGSCTWNSVCNRVIGGRPAISYSEISLNASNKTRRKDGILEVEYGEYPQTIVSKEYANILENEFLNRRLNKTGKIYTTDSVKYEDAFRYQDMDIPFKANTYVEYEYNGKKYIRFVSNSNSWGEVLSDGRKIQDKEIYWVEVEPIKWLIDEKKGLALSKKVVFAGVQFDRKSKYNGSFEKSDIKRFMDSFFSKEIREDRFTYVNRKLDEIEENTDIKSNLRLIIYEFIKADLFDELNEKDNKKDSFISYMNVVFDSDTYYEMHSKLKLLKRAVFTYGIGNKTGALKLLKEIDSDKHKEIFNGERVSYTDKMNLCMNIVEKPKRVIDRMKKLYSRIDNNFDIDHLDSIHDDATTLKDLCNKINYYKLGKSVKRKVKSIFAK